MKNFAVGCNYWASNAGAYTWRFFDKDVIKKDLDVLQEHGVDTIRVFPLWPDFQPLHRGNTFSNVFPLRHNEKIPNDPDGLDEQAVENFSFLLDEAEKHGMQVIVAIINGWMSGRWYAPEFLQNVNLLCDTKAIIWEARFAKAFVKRFKDRACIVAWEPGNECNCLNSDWTTPTTLEQAELWLSAVTNAIRAADNTRPVYSGMHGVFYSRERAFNTDMLARYTDVQTTHPYPNFTPHCNREGVLTMRSALHAAAESVFYSDLTNQPCMVEEINTLGPMLLHDDFVPEFLDKTMFSSYQYGTNGYLWWCGFDQEKLNYLPYDEISLECNLGLCYSNQQPKPVMKEMKKLCEQIQEIGEFAPYTRHAVVIISDTLQDWTSAYGAFCLAAQAGFTVEFMAESQPLKDSDYYIIPCLGNPSGPPKYLIQALEEKIKNGAKLLITYDGGYIYDFNTLTGVKVTAKEVEPKNRTFIINDNETNVTSKANLQFVCDTATPVIQTGDDVLLTENKLGNGSVFFCNAALENYYSETFEAYKTNLYEIYKILTNDLKTPLRVESPLCALTFHETDSVCKVLITKFSNEKQIPLAIDGNYEIEETKYCQVKDNQIFFDGNFAAISVKRK